MGWFANYNSDARQYIVDEVTYEPFSYYTIAGAHWEQTTYTISERYVGITQAGAIADADTLSAANPDWIVTARPENNGGGWTITVTRQTVSAWREIT